MTRWITFDQESARVLADAALAPDIFPPANPAELAIEAALAGRIGVAVLAGEGGKSAYLLTAQCRNPADQRAPETPAHYEATGFLGLLDEPIYEEEPPPVKQSWWKKLVG